MARSARRRDAVAGRRAAELLEKALRAAPEHAGLWLELGRVCQEPIRRLQALQQARALGAVQPNLLAWLARAALAAHDTAAADAAAAELLALVDEGRSVYGDKLDWPERGRDLWARARAAHENNPEPLRDWVRQLHEREMPESFQE